LALVTTVGNHVPSLRGLSRNRILYLLLRESPCSPLGFHAALMVQIILQKARAAYQDFLAVWKVADPDIPILKQAKAEYEMLR
jgi:hypothetical protein